MPGIIVYGWDLTKEEDYQIILDNNDGSPKFKNDLEEVIEKLENNRHRNLIWVKYNDVYHYALGIELDHFEYGNVLLTNVVMTPTHEEKEDLIELVDSLDDKSKEFIKQAGEPFVFMLMSD